MDDFKDTVFVIRSVNERTEALCKKLIIDQGVDAKDIEIVREFPFSKALEVSYEIGRKSDRDWLFCIDADVLLRPYSIKKMMIAAQRQSPKVFEVQSYIFDKFFGNIRVGGVHLYRTNFLNQSIQILNKSDQSTRPEATILKQMEIKGYPYVIVPEVVGLHDFEQHSFDIFRKSFVYSHKHMERMHEIVPFWRGLSTLDEDYVTALFGFSEGIKYCDAMKIDNTLPEIHAGWKKYSSVQKAILEINKIDLMTIESWYYKGINAKKNGMFKPLPFLSNKKSTVVRTVLDQILYLYRELGPINAFSFLIGSVLKKAGKKLQRIQDVTNG